MQALRFGEHCCLVKTKAGNQASNVAGLIATLSAQIAEKESLIESKERWVTIRQITIDKFDGMRQIKNVSKLVGAEKERHGLYLLNY